LPEGNKETLREGYMNSIQTYVPIFATLIFVIINIELIKKEKLKENFGVLWIMISFIMLVTALNIKILINIAALFNTKNIASLSYSMAIFLLFLLGLFFSVKMSTYEKQIKNLIQQVSILTKRIESGKS
jgi:hypothetical protein